MNTEQKNLRSSAVYEEKSIDESSLSFSDEMSNEIEDKTCFYVIAGVSAAAVVLAVVVGIVISCCCCCGEKAPEVPAPKTKPDGEEKAAAKAKAEAKAAANPADEPYAAFGKKFNLDADLTAVLTKIKLEWSNEALNNVDYAVKVVNAHAKVIKKSIDDKKFRSIHTEYKTFVLGLRQEKLDEWKKGGANADKGLDATLQTLKHRYETWGGAYSKYAEKWEEGCADANLNDKEYKFTIPNKPGLDEKMMGARGGVSLYYPPFTNGAESGKPGHLSEFLLRDGDDKQGLMIVEVKHSYGGPSQSPTPELEKDLPKMDWGARTPTPVRNDDVIKLLKAEIGEAAIPAGIDRKIKGTQCAEVKKGTKWTQEFVQAWSLSDDAEQQYLNLGGGADANRKCREAFYGKDGLGTEVEIIGWHGAALEYIAQIVKNKFNKPEKKSAWKAETGEFTVVENYTEDAIVDFNGKMKIGEGDEFQTTEFPTYMFQKEVLGKFGFYMTSDTKKAVQYATPYSTSKSAPGPNMWMKRLAKGDEKDLPRICGPFPQEHTAPRQFLLVMKGKLINFATLLSGNQELQMNRIPINTWAVACADAAKL